jgi:hypothetical protein
LEEGRPFSALRESLQQHRPSAHRAHQRLLDPQVVRGQIPLRIAALREVHPLGMSDYYPRLSPPFHKINIPACTD